MNLVALLLSLILMSTSGASVDVCKPDEYACPDEDKCIPWHWFCDGKADCRDESDELSVESGSEGFPCRRHRFTCLLPLEYKTREDIFCRDRVECSSDDFACADGSRCIPWDDFCNERKECWDGSDEVAVQPGLPGIYCKIKDTNRVCLLPEAYRHKMNGTCNGNVIRTCKPDDFVCLDGSGCIDPEMFCDGNTNCKDGSDEISIHSKLPGIPCRPTRSRYWSSNICKLHQDRASQRDHFCEQEAKCSAGEFACLDGTMCISWSAFCDYYRPYCSDGSDRISIKSKKYDGVPCRVEDTRGITLCKLPRKYASQKTDICIGAPRCRRKEFPCLDGTRCLPLDQFCDGGPDCDDKSDELKPTNRTKIICRRGSNFCALPLRMRRKQKLFCDEIVNCSAQEFECSSGEKCIPKDQFCDGSPQCSDGSDEILSTSEGNGTACLGEHGIVCALYGSEALKKYTLCSEPDLQCKEDEFTCRDKKRCLEPYWWCDGEYYCGDLSDHIRTYLPPGMTGIPCRFNEYVCILPEDQKSKQELLCKKNPECDGDEFACLDGSACIPKKSFCDGWPHCFDRSDEIAPASNISGVTCYFLHDSRESICVLPESQAEKKNALCPQQ